ncbi:hypothetical protein BHF71_06705 [Vulcanibacillus modesticaldus]|uniref:Alanine--tRNA ligase n=1 Tax=Vulcanibacillus modesticaldus TaxID=337097 RepID=A0A1D2YWM1_9BACI|nr:DHHA1 domain-containing protein [Vulcanibacillus modesticaldus]OEG00046.1 hypothetical protein BHF71_06705 [Vulcanibacillus modesticaldus]
MELITKKLFDENPYLKECTGKVLKECVREDGLYEVVLDQTIFYPTGGGQPNDTGLINDIAVVDVYKQKGIIYHLLESSLNGAQEVICKLDWQRRFDFMQQHSGQHILSRAFETLFEAQTVGFHLGEEVVTIDVELKELTEVMVRAVEELSNKIIMENRVILSKLLSADELSEEEIKKIPELDKYVKLVIVDDFDQCACAGTHPKTTAEIGLIKILGWEKVRKNIRVTFVAGKRAVGFFTKFQNQLFKTAAVLKTNWADIGEKVSYILDEKLQLEKQVKELTAKKIQYEIEEWKNKAVNYDEFYLVEAVFKDRDVNEIRQLAQGIVNSPSYVVLFANVTGGKVQFVLQRSSNLEVAMNDCLKLGLELVDGKGGGNTLSAQGGGQNIRNTEEAIKRMRDYLISI